MLLLEWPPRVRTFDIPPRLVQAAKERGQGEQLSVLGGHDAAAVASLAASVY